MHLLEDDGGMVNRTWYFVQETPGVIKFAGTKDKPMSMRKREVDSMLSQITEQEGAVKPKIAFEVGDTVRVADGPFEGQNGVVEEIDPEAGKLRVAVTIFRPLPTRRDRLLAGRERLGDSTPRIGCPTDGVGRDYTNNNRLKYPKPWLKKS